MSLADLSLEEVGVYLGVLLPFFRHVAILSNRADGADWLTGAALDANVGIDEVLLIRVGGVDAIDGASLYARRVFDIDAWLADGICHIRTPILK